MEINAETNTIAVHGREAMDLPYYRTDDNNQKVDISTAVLYIEVPGANIRKLLVSNPRDPRSLRIFLTREEVGRLPTTPSPFIVIDETDAAQPFVELEGQIYRKGFKAAPVNPAPGL
ncbi:MAG: hypothetical protein EOO77_34990 [Oxalobacteraceae bacterium]|nr:MAG: hypothetical protein EOO77_34990 [Oxalobacteraceae bacterium]